MENTVIIKDFLEVKGMIEAARKASFQSVNVSLIHLYWRTGAFVSKRLQTAAWGDGVVELLANWLRQQGEHLKGFSKRGIYRMVQFYETYSSPEFQREVTRLLAPRKGAKEEMRSSAMVQGKGANPQDGEKVSALLTQISWTNHLQILTGKRTLQERLFYLLLCRREKLSSRELKRQMDSSMYERTMTGKHTMTEVLKSVPTETSMLFRDSYSLELLGLPAYHDETELRKRIVSHLKEFFLEFGRDFTYVGEEYRLQVGNHDYSVDLLLFHRELRCLVAVELKAREFEPQDLGQLEFYLAALDQDVRKPFENPSIGLLLCKEKDDAVVQYALSRSASPALIAEYTRLLPDKEVVRQRMLELIGDEGI